MAETVPQLLDAGADEAPAILSEDGAILDHAGLRQTVASLRDAMRTLGVTGTDRIAIVLPNGPAMAVAFLAAAVTGCAAPLNPRYRADEFRFYLDDIGARVLITAPDGPEAEIARAAAAENVLHLTMQGALDTGFQLAPGGAPVPAESSVPQPDGDTTAASDASAGTAADHARDDATAASRLASVSEDGGPDDLLGTPAASDDPGPDDVALVLHTSGTTSRPKIVPLRQRNLARSATGIAESLHLTASDRSLNVMPLFHIHGLLAGLLAPLSTGGSVACTTGFDAFRFFTQLRSLQPTYYTAVPTMHQMVLARSARHVETARAAGLRFVRSSSASLPTPVLDDLHRLFAVPVIEAYGMTEATHQMCANPLPPGEAKIRSVGLPTGIDLAILDSAGNVLPAATRGEVSIKGATVIDGYENNPAADAEAFTGGWFRTGDEGYLDDDGYLFLTGRLKEQINRGGEKVSPLEVDEILLRHRAVAQAVTFAMPHDKLGEEVAAAVVLEPEAADATEVTEAALRAFVGESLAAFKVPRRIVFCDELPKGPTGKLQRIGLATRLNLP